MAIPKEEEQANANKKRIDDLTSVLLGLDRASITEQASKVAKHIQKPFQIVVCGAAGASKTTFSNALSSVLDIPSFDFDEYIQGGWTQDKAKYQGRILDGLDSLWDDLSKAWIVEHVEACSPTFLRSLDPKWAIHLRPEKEQLKAVAQTRDLVSNESDGVRAQRAISTSRTSLTHFESAPGNVVASGTGWVLKELR